MPWRGCAAGYAGTHRSPPVFTGLTPRPVPPNLRRPSTIAPLSPIAGASATATPSARAPDSAPPRPGPSASDDACGAFAAALDGALRAAPSSVYEGPASPLGSAVSVDVLTLAVPPGEAGPHVSDSATTGPAPGPPAPDEGQPQAPGPSRTQPHEVAAPSSAHDPEPSPRDPPPPDPGNPEAGVNSGPAVPTLSLSRPSPLHTRPHADGRPAAAASPKGAARTSPAKTRAPSPGPGCTSPSSAAPHKMALMDLVENSPGWPLRKSPYLSITDTAPPIPIPYIPFTSGLSSTGRSTRSASLIASLFVPLLDLAEVVPPDPPAAQHTSEDEGYEEEDEEEEEDDEEEEEEEEEEEVRAEDGAPRPGRAALTQGRTRCSPGRISRPRSAPAAADARALDLGRRKSEGRRRQQPLTTQQAAKALRKGLQSHEAFRHWNVPEVERRDAEAYLPHRTFGVHALDRSPRVPGAAPRARAPHETAPGPGPRPTADPPLVQIVQRLPRPSSAPLVASRGDWYPETRRNLRLGRAARQSDAPAPAPAPPEPNVTQLCGPLDDPSERRPAAHRPRTGVNPANLRKLPFRSRTIGGFCGDATPGATLDVTGLPLPQGEPRYGPSTLANSRTGAVKGRPHRTAFSGRRAPRVSARTITKP